jgi:hypothetical protein
LFGQTFRCSSRRAGPRCFSVTATQPQASQEISRSAAFTARRVRAASPAGQSCSSNSRRAHRSEGRSQRRPQTPHDATPGLLSASSASSRRFALPQATRPALPTGTGSPVQAGEDYNRECSVERSTQPRSSDELTQATSGEITRRSPIICPTLRFDRTGRETPRATGIEPAKDSSRTAKAIKREHSRASRRPPPRARDTPSSRFV